MATILIFQGRPMFSIETETKLGSFLFCSLKHATGLTSDSIVPTFSFSYRRNAAPVTSLSSTIFYETVLMRTGPQASRYVVPRSYPGLDISRASLSEHKTLLSHKWTISLKTVAPSALCLNVNGKATDWKPGVRSTVGHWGPCLHKHVENDSGLIQPTVGSGNSVNNNNSIHLLTCLTTAE
jgi:hypothetical protein